MVPSEIAPLDLQYIILSFLLQHIPAVWTTLLNWPYVLEVPLGSVWTVRHVISVMIQEML
jgi:hypothetical protein